MFKKAVIILGLFLVGQVFAASATNVLTQNKSVFLYFYSQSCDYCKKFNPNYDKLVKDMGSSYKFVKVDVETSNGAILARAFGTRYVPYVIVSKNYGKTVANIPAQCLIKYACVNKTAVEFLK
jgi:thioredoxin-like negative regulator of GroEL